MGLRLVRYLYFRWTVFRIERRRKQNKKAPPDGGAFSLLFGSLLGLWL
jgi:hypothetical protein